MSECVSAESRADRQPGGRRHSRRTVYRSVLVQRDGDKAGVLPEPGNWVACNDCIAISWPLLALSALPAEWLYPAEQIHLLLWGRI